ncbi:Uncharacterised protein [Candidatus Tiddalikarchaeum anstoanum]|nr:Uncharacterised protein [Candidatus Tiddalikarchaeum anstoanum]
MVESESELINIVNSYENNVVVKVLLLEDVVISGYHANVNITSEFYHYLEKITDRFKRTEFQDNSTYLITVYPGIRDYTRQPVCNVMFKNGKALVWSKENDPSLKKDAADIATLSEKLHSKLYGWLNLTYKKYELK